MKILFLGDKHQGCGNSTFIANHQLKCLDNMLEYMQANNINTIVAAGDAFESRKVTDNYFHDMWKCHYYDKLASLGITEHNLVGNHDAFYTNTLVPNTPRTLLSHYKNVHVYDTPVEIVIGGVKIAMIPWICKDNRKDCETLIAKSDAEILVGHLEMTGALMNGKVCNSGLDMKAFAHYKHVYSGHFHMFQEFGNITYIGTPCETSWADYNQPKGFIVFDTETMTQEFVEYTDRLCNKIVYIESMDMNNEINPEVITGKLVKVVIQERNDFKKYEKWLAKLESLNPHKLDVSEPYLSLDGKEQVVVDVENLNTKSTETIIGEYVAEVYPERSDKLHGFLLSLHSEAVELIKK